MIIMRVFLLLALIVCAVTPSLLFAGSVSQLNPASEQQRLQKLEKLEAHLKKKYVGLDHAIKQIIARITPWWVYPESLNAPTVIPIYGPTGTGKTDLVREIVKFLGVDHNFLELDLGGMSKEKSAGERSHHSIFGHLAEFYRSGPAVLSINELQHARTIENGREIETGSDHVTFWRLLDDGSILREVENGGIAKLHQTISAGKRFDPSLASNHPMELIAIFPGKSLREIMEMAKIDWKKFKEKALRELSNMPGKSLALPLPNTLIFLSGNLDGAYGIRDLEGLPPEIIYEKTKEVTQADIARELKEWFRQEQVGRLSRSPILLSTLSPDENRKLIAKQLKNLKNKFKDQWKIELAFGPSVTHGLYDEVVEPTLGARRIIKGIQEILGQRLVLWGEMARDTGYTRLRVDFSTQNFEFEVECYEGNGTLAHRFSDRLEFSRQRELMSPHAEPLRSQNSLYQAARAVAHIALENFLPSVIKTKMQNSEAGTMLLKDSVSSINGLPDRAAKIRQIAITLAPYVAESMISGSTTTAHSGDLRYATSVAINMVGGVGMGGTLAKYDTRPRSGGSAVIPLENEMMERTGPILAEAEDLAKETLNQQMELLRALAFQLRERTVIGETEIGEIVRRHYAGSSEEVQRILTNQGRTSACSEAWSRFVSDVRLN